MRVGNNAEVAKAWKENRSMRNGNWSFYTNGRDLHSYDLEIGYTTSHGHKCLRNFQKISVTTNRHLATARLIWIDDSNGYWSPRIVKADAGIEKAFRDVAKGVAERNRDLYGSPQNR